jgi:hypothetical protein
MFTKGEKAILLGMSHDLMCARDELESAARCFTSWRRAFEHPASVDLARAAIAFAIQFAIEAGQDPVQMRVLERELIALVQKEAPRR